MAGHTRPSVNKRLREAGKKEKQVAKAERRAQRQARDDCGVFRLFHETRDGVIVAHLHEAETGDFRDGKRNRGDRHIGVRGQMLADDLAKIHPVELVAGQDEHVVEVVVPDVPIGPADRVGGALVPVRGDTLLRRQQLDEFAHAAVEETPAVLHMPDQALRLVLREHGDAADAGVERVGQREVDDAHLHHRPAAGQGHAHETRHHAAQEPVPRTLGDATFRLDPAHPASRDVSPLEVLPGERLAGLRQRGQAVARDFVRNAEAIATLEGVLAITARLGDARL